MFTEHVHSSRSAAKAGTVSKVLATAYELFLTQGYATTSIRTIASEAGVSVGTVMGVGDKQTLLIRTIGQHISELHDDIRGQSDSLLDVLRPFLQMFTGHEELSRAFGAALIQQGNQGEALTALKTLLTDEITLRLGTRLSSADAAEYADLPYNVYLGLLIGWAAGIYDTEHLTSQAASSIERLNTAFGVTQ